MATNIVSTQFNLKNRALEIYFSGCKQGCKGCHNPELKNFSLGSSHNKWLKQIFYKVKEFNSLIDNVWILGGEPLDNDLWDVWEVILNIPDKKDIWLFTSYELDQVPVMYKIWCKYIKCGKYIEELRVDNNIQYGVKLATSNQKIYKKGIDY